MDGLGSQKKVQMLLLLQQKKKKVLIHGLQAKNVKMNLMIIRQHHQNQKTIQKTKHLKKGQREVEDENPILRLSQVRTLTKVKKDMTIGVPPPQETTMNAPKESKMAKLEEEL